MNPLNEAEAAAKLKEHVERWRLLGPKLERIRLDALESIVTAEAVSQLSLAFGAAAKLPPRETSGLVEQQRIFMKLRKQ